MSQIFSPNVGLNVAPVSTANATHIELGSTLSPYGPLFGRLPMELRILVWIDVLVSSGTIAKAHSFMRPQEPLVVANFPPAKDIDAALLRTCRAIYEETFPILYGNNSFVFYHTSEITEFAFGKLYFPFGRHLLDSPLGQALKCNVRIPAIGITGVAGCISQSLTPMIPLLTTRIDTNIYAGKTFDASFHDFEPDVREAAWSVWAEFLQPSSEQHSLIFPALEDLRLDFSAWYLEKSNESKLRVEPFLRKLRPCGGLQRLSIFGILHEQNLNDFKHGFVKEGGRFKAVDTSYPRRWNVLVDEIVSYSNLHTVSKGVRDILQRDGVPAFIL